VPGQAETSYERAATLSAPGRSGSNGLRRGSFELHFPEEDSAKAAARDARTVGFVVAISEGDFGRWLFVSRRNDAFPADDGDRYASRLRAIADLHGGTYDRFVPE
jgi:hypothetical protein